MRFNRQEITLLVLFTTTIVVCVGILVYGAIANAAAIVPARPSHIIYVTPTVTQDVSRSGDPVPGITPATAHISTENVPDGKCHEDDPCWDCHTMGNRVCGKPTLLPHTS